MQKNPRIFWVVVIGLVVLLVGATVLLVTLGGTPTVRARSVSPADNSSASTSPRIAVTFARPMQQASLNGNVFIDPAIPFELGWLENELRIIPLSALQADTQYTVTVGPGVKDNTGAEMSGTVKWSFRTRQPRIVYLRPDGRSALGEVWISNQDGSEPLRLSGEGQRVNSFSVAPDGSAVVYAVVEGDLTANLWRADIADNRQTQLTREQDIYYQVPQYNPSGDMVSVEVRRPLIDTPGELAPPVLELRRPLDGTPAGIIYDGEGAIAYAAQWSPDGAKIAFIDGNARSIGVFNFTPDYRFFPVSNLELSQQAWSPDSTLLLYSNMQLTEVGALLSIVTRNIGTGAETLMLPDIIEGGEPVWSPDGNYVAYSFAPAEVQSRGRGIWITSRDGVEVILVTAEPFITNTRPIWSPDGEWLLFNKIDPVAGFNAPPAVWLIRPDGTDAHIVADFGLYPVWIP